MKPFRSLPVRLHLILCFTLLAAVTLLISVVLSERKFERQSRQAFENEITATAALLANNLRAAMAFEAYDEAEKLLQSLASRSTTEKVYLLNQQGQTVASYKAADSEMTFTPEAFKQPSTTQGAVHLLRQPIIHDGEELGALLMVERMESLSLTAQGFTDNTLLNFGLCLLFSLVLAYLLGYRISRPIIRLSQIAQTITDHRDYSIRSPAFGMPEVNELSETFNKMLERMQQSEAELKDHVQQLVHEQENLRLAQARERDLETKLSNAKRMESLGLLAGGVAHDLNNLLGPVLAYPDLILSQLTPGDPICGDIREIKSAAQKSAAIIQDLLTLARRGTYHTEVVSLNQIIASFLDSPAFRSRIQNCPHIEVQKYFDPELPNLVGSVPHLTQVVMNICFNAMESMAQGGTLTIRTERMDLHRTIHTTSGDLPPGLYATLKVMDEGHGIPQEALSHIFEPFYTRKKLGHGGTGLGLSVVYGITSDLGGKLHVESDPGTGSTFSLYFPGTTMDVMPVDTESLPEGRNERILIVDDVEAQRKLGTRLLEQIGYRVAQAESGQAALDYIQREHVDLVLLDMIMEPGWDGLETYRHLKQIRPTLRCVICSGYADKSSLHQAELLGLVDHILKPYTVANLAQVVREVLDRPEKPVEYDI